MSSMYGRSDPKPLPPSYSPEDLKKMKRAEEARLLTQSQAATPEDKSWSQISLPPNLGRDCGAYKWTQTQAQVTIFVRLPPSLVFPAATLAKLVKVTLLPNHLSVCVNGALLMGGDLCKEIKCDESTWFVADGILEITLLKRYRRGLIYQKVSAALTSALSFSHQNQPQRSARLCNFFMRTRPQSKVSLADSFYYLFFSHCSILGSWELRARRMQTRSGCLFSHRPRRRRPWVCSTLLPRTTKRSGRWGTQQARTTRA